MEVGRKGDYILTLHCHHQNDFCIKVGSGESHFNVSLIVRNKVTRSQATTLEEKGEPKRIRTAVPLLNALPPGQTGLGGGGGGGGQKTKQKNCSVAGCGSLIQSLTR